LFVCGSLTVEFCKFKLSCTVDKINKYWRPPYYSPASPLFLSPTWFAIAPSCYVYIFFIHWTQVYSTTVKSSMDDNCHIKRMS